MKYLPVAIKLRSALIRACLLFPKSSYSDKTISSLKWCFASVIEQFIALSTSFIKHIRLCQRGATAWQKSHPFSAKLLIDAIIAQESCEVQMDILDFSDPYNDYISFHTWRRWHRQMILTRASLAVGALVVLAVMLY